jgi:inhibitor of KinA sporulation pathway (predicted exonuclease)
MDYVVFDLEWNQCPEGKEKEEKALPFEILEIGAIKLDSSYHEIGRFSEKVRPTVYSSIHSITQELLHLDMEELRKARTFPEVLADFFYWCGGPVNFCTWGPLDLYELQRNMKYYKLINPFRTPLRYYDIQKIFSIVYEDRKTRRSLEYAADFLQIKKSGPFHDAFRDAEYTTQIMKRIPSDVVLKNFSIDYFQPPRNRKEEVHAVFDNYYKFVSREFSSKSIAMKDWKVNSTKCYMCRRNTKKKIRWFSSGNGHYLCLSYCEEHGWLRGKIRFKKAPSGNYFCIKTVKPISEEEALEIYDRKKILMEKR